MTKLITSVKGTLFRNKFYAESHILARKQQCGSMLVNFWDGTENHSAKILEIDETGMIAILDKDLKIDCECDANLTVIREVVK